MRSRPLIIGRHSAKVKSKCEGRESGQARPLTVLKGLIGNGRAGPAFEVAGQLQMVRIAYAMRRPDAKHRLKPPSGGMGGAACESETGAPRVPRSEKMRYVKVPSCGTDHCLKAMSHNASVSDCGKEVPRPRSRNPRASIARFPYQQRGSTPRALDVFVAGVIVLA